jgi:hypothetical protein
MKQTISTYMTPGPYQCYIYEDREYNGNYKIFDVNTSRCTSGTNPQGPEGTMYFMPDHDFNDKMSSWVCGSNVIADFCRNSPDEWCYHDGGQHASGPSRNPGPGFNDSLTTLFMTCANDTKRAAVIFNDDGCKGDSMRVDIPDGKSTTLNKNDCEYLGLKNDRANSVMVPEGYTLKLYKNDGLTGDV